MMVPTVVISQITPGEEDLTGEADPVGLVDKLHEAQDTVTEFMATSLKTTLNEGYVDGEVYLEAVWVDEENEKLVIWLNPVHLSDPIDADDLREELGIDVPVYIQYGSFFPATSNGHPLITYLVYSLIIILPVIFGVFLIKYVKNNKKIRVNE